MSASGTGLAWQKLVGSCFGLGLSPVAPGTVGTLGGVALAWALVPTGEYFPVAIAACAALLYAVGRWFGDWAERDAGGKDPQWFVLDEVLGYLVTVAWWLPPTPLALAVGFAAFRLFDVTKPPPVRRLERYGGGDGILLDDVMAGVYAFVVMAALRTFLLTPADWSILAGGA